MSRSLRQLVMFFIFVVTVPAIVEARHTAQHRADEAAIRRLVQEVAVAWNRHDAGRLAGLWSVDGDFVNPGGGYSSGRAAIESFLAAEHAGPMARTRMKNTVKRIQFLSENTAHGDVGSVIAFAKRNGYRHPDFTHDVSFVAVKSGGKWRFSNVRAYALFDFGKKMCDKKSGTCNKGDHVKKQCDRTGKDCKKDFCPKDDASCKKDGKSAHHCKSCCKNGCHKKSECGKKDCHEKQCGKKDCTKKDCSKAKCHDQNQDKKDCGKESCHKKSGAQKDCQDGLCKNQY